MLWREGRPWRDARRERIMRAVVVLRAVLKEEEAYARRVVA